MPEIISRLWRSIVKVSSNQQRQSFFNLLRVSDRTVYLSSNIPIIIQIHSIVQTLRMLEAWGSREI